MEYAEEIPCVDEEAGDEEYQEEPDSPLSQASQSPGMSPEARMVLDVVFKSLATQQSVAWLPEKLLLHIVVARCCTLQRHAFQHFPTLF